MSDRAPEKSKSPHEPPADGGDAGDGRPTKAATPAESSSLAQEAAPESEQEAETADSAEGASPAAGDEGDSVAPGADRPELGPPPNGVLRSVYYTLWFVLVPFVAVALLVWGLTPPSGEAESGPLAPLQAAVRSQPVPISIVLFVMIATAFLLVGHRLPLAAHAHPPLPEGVSPDFRAAFGRARALVDEARLLRARHGSKVSGRARQAARAATHALEAAMTQKPFDPERFERTVGKLEDVLDGRFSAFRKGEVREYIESIGFAILVALGLRAVVVEAFKIPSGSMIPTLQVGDHIFVNKFIYGPAIPFTSARFWKNLPPKRGDVMVFAYPEDPEKDFIKRVIGLPGDRVEARNGHPVINGWEVPSCLVGTYEYDDFEPIRMRRSGQLFVEYLGTEAFLTLYNKQGDIPGKVEGPYSVLPNQVFVMGDNRHNSHDSRAWFNGQGGGVPFENIRGKALFVWLSLGNSMDWGRLGTPVMGRPRLPADMKHLDGAMEKCLRERPAGTNPPAATPG